MDLSGVINFCLAHSRGFLETRYVRAASRMWRNLQTKEKFNVTEPASPQAVSSLSSPVTAGALMEALKVRRRMAAAIVVFGTLVGIAYSLLATPRFQAEASFMPPSDAGGGGAAALLSQFGGLSGLGGTALGIKDPAQMYVGLLGSRELLAEISKEFRLDTVYRIDDRDDILMTLKGLSSFSVGKDGIIRVMVTDEDPMRAAALANTFVKNLQRRLNNYGLVEATARREFFESQLQQVKERLWKAEVSLKEAQTKSGVLEPTGQATMTLSAIAELRAQLSAKLIQLKTAEGSLASDNSTLRQLRQEIQAIRAELSQLKNGRSYDVFVKADELPEAITDYYRALREVKYQEALFEIISKQFELAKLDGEHSSTILKVVDHATPPSKRTFPKRSLIAAISLLIATIFAVITCYFLRLADLAWESMEIKKDPRRSDSWWIRLLSGTRSA